MHDAVRRRFSATAEQVAARVEAQRAGLEARVRRFVQPRGDERALDSGTGAGALALALAPHVREVVAVDIVPELLAQARRLADGLANVTFAEADATQLPFDRGEFDLAGTLRTLHHVQRPELAVAELARVTRRSGHILVVDQLGPTDPLAAIELDRFERARDESHTRLLMDVDMRSLFEANGLVLLRSEVVREPRALDPYFDVAGCAGADRERARELAPDDPYIAEIGWYLLRR